MTLSADGRKRHARTPLASDGLHTACVSPRLRGRLTPSSRKVPAPLRKGPRQRPARTCVPTYSPGLVTRLLQADVRTLVAAA